MKEQQVNERLIELLNTPICKMDGKDLVFLIKSITSDQLCQMHNGSYKEESVVSEEHKLVYGIAGIAQIFGCSIPTASRIKASGVINGAIAQVGRKIVVDVDKALALAKEKRSTKRRIPKNNPHFGEKTI